MSDTLAERVNTVVIGGGQAGLSVGYHLGRLGVPFVILDASHRVGDAWRKRWDSLRLFTPAKFAGLDGWPFPGPRDGFPTKDDMANYLESYAKHFGLPVRSGVRVQRLSRLGTRFLVVTDHGRYDADNVVVAMGNFQTARIPLFASELAPEIAHLHSSAYLRPTQFQDGDVLVVGAGNSGAEIALEAARAHRTYLAGPATGNVPYRIEGRPAQLLLTRLLLRVIFHRVLTIATPIGRRLRPRMLHRGAPLIRTRPKDLKAAGVVRVPRVVGVRNGQPLLEDGRVLPVANVVWCTGYTPGFSWIDLPIFDAGGEPMHEGGVVTAEPGLFFVGLHFLYAFSSEMIHGVGRDAGRIAALVARRPAQAVESAERASAA